VFEVERNSVNKFKSKIVRENIKKARLFLN
jgi:hypothetical protein